MKATIKRMETSAEGTFGKLFVDGNFMCYTGELPRYAGNPEIENERRTDCIPAGTYGCQLKMSPKFGRVYELKKVPNRDGILIHKGNFCGDKAKGFKSDVEGCILLGSAMSKLDGQKVVTSSRIAFDKFMLYAAGKPFTLEIVWEEN